MPYDKSLAERIRSILLAQPELIEKKMFGGICFMLQGNMCCGVLENRLILRINGPQYDELLTHDSVSVMDFTGKPMRGFLYVDPNVLQSEEGLVHWLSHAIEYCLALPAK